MYYVNNFKLITKLTLIKY